MAHTAEFLIKFDPAPFIKQGFETEDFHNLGFTDDELELVGIYQLSRHIHRDMDEVYWSWSGYVQYITELEKDRVAEEKRSMESLRAYADSLETLTPSRFFSVTYERLLELKREHLPSYSLMDSDPVGILFTNGMIVLDNIKVVKECTSDKSAMAKVETRQIWLEGQLVRHWLKGGFHIIDEVVVGEYRKPKKFIAQPLLSVLTAELHVNKDATLRECAEELQRVIHSPVNPNVLMIEKLGDREYLTFKQPAITGGMIELIS